jgi:hypothetical protein
VDIRIRTAAWLHNKISKLKRGAASELNQPEWHVGAASSGGGGGVPSSSPLSPTAAPTAAATAVEQRPCVGASKVTKDCMATNEEARLCMGQADASYCRCLQTATGIQQCMGGLLLPGTPSRHILLEDTFRHILLEHTFRQILLEHTFRHILLEDTFRQILLEHTFPPYLAGARVLAISCRCDPPMHAARHCQHKWGG